MALPILVSGTNIVGGGNFPPSLPGGGDPSRGSLGAEMGCKSSPQFIHTSLEGATFSVIKTTRPPREIWLGGELGKVCLCLLIESCQLQTSIVKMQSYAAVFLSFLAAVQPFVSAQLSGTVGPTTTRAKKAATKVCNILDYGGTASATTDNSAAIASAWAACKTGGEVYIPTGDYGLGTWVTLTGGSSVSINLEGTIYRTGTASGNMIFIEHTTDFEFYSANSKGAIQGYGYEFHKKGTYGPRILRFYKVVDFSFHDIALVDSPAFHFTLDSCTNGEVYNTIIRGGNEGE